ncbi:response regulator [Neobacillus sp.]|uniref:response regulator n=1 Tax=Neobacillus sp. TaxID=2675273 RepID=UPI0028A2A128|nr:response regulator [Neobacillus sp.]
MKFRTKLYTSIGSIVVLISICVIVLMNMLEQSMVNIDVVVTDKYERINMAATIKYETVNIARELREITVNQSNATLTTSINALEESNININRAMESLERIDSKGKSRELMTKYKVLHETYLATAQQVIAIKKTDPKAAIQPQLLNDLKLTGERMVQLAELLRGLQEQEMKNELYRSRDTYHWAISTIYFYLAVCLCLGIGFIIWIIRGMTKDLNHVTTVMKSVTNSSLDALPRIEIFSKGEIGAIAAAFNKMVSKLEAHSKREKQLKEEAGEHNWLKSKIAEILAMYPEAKDVQMLAELFITKLVPMVGACNGVFYIKTVEGNEQYLKKIAAYAFFNPNREFESFRMGEGLIGQCALEKQHIFLNQVPDNYIKIRSGIGGATPKNIIILPIQYEDEVLAVIEIASFESFSPSQIKLIEEVIPTTGITLKSMLNHMKAERLLQESQSLTEELQAQSEELQLQQEELRSTNEQLEDQYAASVHKKEELEKVREQLEEKAQQLEISSQYKSEFLANMSHELRTPLNSLLILAQILSENGEGNLTAKQEEYIRTIYASGNDLLHLINDILDLAKVESGKLDVIHSEVDLHGVEDYIMMQFSPIAYKKNIQFIVHVEPDLPSIFYTDEHRLQQILKNLLSNAFKFTESGSVTLLVQKVIKETARQPILVNNYEEEFMLAFSVIDTGIGIAREKQGTIFDAFKQADGTTSRKYGGTGLGLSICREIAYLLGGFMELTSEVGKGSNFTLYLPYDQVNEPKEVKSYMKEASAGLENKYYLPEVTNTMDEEDSSNEQLGKSSLKDKKVLIVDDDIRNVYALTIALEKYEMEIIVADNGREGIEVLHSNPDTDIILMDIMMPEMDGFEAIRTIRSNHKFISLPIIALTAKAMKHAREECLDAGATDYISKPLNLDQLFSLMHVWLYRKEG